MERTNKLWILDSTLRDGAQGENISFSVQDKLRIVSALDQLGIDYIEAGNPASNPKDLEFFERVRALPLRHARLAAFGSTRRKDERAEDSEGLRALLQANTPAVCIFGKSWDFHVTHILHTTLEENLRMIEQSVAFLKANGREVIFDAEHFFDGYAWNPSYALASLDAALAAAPTDQGEAAYRAAVAAALPEGMTLDAEAGVVRWVESAEDGRSLVCAAALAPAGEFPRLDWLEHRLVTELNASPEE